MAEFLEDLLKGSWEPRLSKWYTECFWGSKVIPVPIPVTPYIALVIVKYVAWLPVNEHNYIHVYSLRSTQICLDCPLGAGAYGLLLYRRRLNLGGEYVSSF